MIKSRLELSAVIALAMITAVSYFDIVSIAAITFAAGVHEAGHAAVMKLLGIRIKDFSAELKGLCISYADEEDEVITAAAALAGPAAGMMFAVVSRSFGQEWIRLSGSLSFVMSVFNLLPAFPLDGGRIFDSLMGSMLNNIGTVISSAVSVLVAVIVFVAGIILYNRGYGAASFSAGVWLLICQNEKLGIVKNTEIR